MKNYYHINLNKMSYWGIGKADQKFLSGLKKKKKQKPAKPAPKPPAKESKKKDKPKRKITGKQWKDAGEALSKSAQRLSDVEAGERFKTQELKDKLYIRRNKKK